MNRPLLRPARLLAKIAQVVALACAVLLAGARAPAVAQETLVPLNPVPDRTADLVSLQRGARLFVNYCIGCHSASLMRYSKLREIGIAPAQIEQNLLFTTDRIGDTMQSAMRAADAKEWFGAVPPDLSVEVRARSPAWVYAYLRSFYRDDSRPTGWNNLVFPNVGMPHALWELQGQRTAVFESETGEGGKKELKFTGFQPLTPGKMSASDYDSALADLVAYMSWMAEPAQKTRKQVGVAVLIFLGIFTFLAWRLNAAYWKGVR
jgi:ubiquinol-cytochrome c reductase cytochrome c1 subunit